MPSTQPIDCVEILGLIKPGESLQLKLATPRIACGFPSPADDHIEESLDLIRHLIKHPAASYFARSKGLSMVRAGILDNAILVVDRSLHPGNNDIVLASVNNDFTCKKLRIVDGCMRLSPESDDKRFKEIIPSEGTEVVIWGVVTSAVNEFRR